MEDDPELIHDVSRHPIYGIAEYYGRIEIKRHWYCYYPEQDCLVRSPNPPLQQELFDAPTQRH